MAHLVVYVLHYVIARLLFDELLRLGVSPPAAFVLTGPLLVLLTRRSGRRSRRR